MSELSNKIYYSDDEVEELNDLMHNHGRAIQLHEILEFLKEKFNFSNTHSIIVDVRKHFNHQHSVMWDKFHEKYKNSTLQETINKKYELEIKPLLDE